MSDHFVLLMDRLITASTLEAVIESRNMGLIPVGNDKTAAADASQKWKLNEEGSALEEPKLVECRICQEEDSDSTMEAPCACCGSLKYAHRKCIQRWCNEKGDTICEICHQPFKPDYTAPMQMTHYGGVPMNFRGSWEISRQDMRNPQFIAMVATDRSFLDSSYDDYHAYNRRSALCCPTIAFIFMLLFILRHAFTISTNGADEYAFTMLLLLVFRTAGILLPIYIMVRLVSFCQWWRRQHQDLLDVSFGRAEDEDERNPPLMHVV